MGTILLVPLFLPVWMILNPIDFFKTMAPFGGQLIKGWIEEGFTQTMITFSSFFDGSFLQ